jgi:hypothetical protein
MCSHEDPLKWDPSTFGGRSHGAFRTFEAAEDDLVLPDQNRAVIADAVSPTEELEDGRVGSFVERGKIRLIHTWPEAFGHVVARSRIVHEP